jgi:hypothetical protein
MEEKDIIELSNEIVESLTKLSLGEKPNIISNKIFKSLSDHVNFIQIKKIYSDFLQNDFNGKYNSSESLKKLTEFRYKIVDLYNINIFNS